MKSAGTHRLAMLSALPVTVGVLSNESGEMGAHKGVTE